MRQDGSSPAMTVGRAPEATWIEPQAKLNQFLASQALIDAALRTRIDDVIIGLDKMFDELSEHVKTLEDQRTKANDVLDQRIEPVREEQDKNKFNIRQNERELQTLTFKIYDLDKELNESKNQTYDYTLELWQGIAKPSLWNHITGNQTESSKSQDKGKNVVEDEGSNTVIIETMSPDESKWFQEDQMVLSILQSSLEQSILVAYSFSEIAKELWDTLKGVYGNISNLSRIFEVKKALNTLQQEEKPFKQHFGEFRALWSELETLRPPTTDLATLNERCEQDQVFGVLFTLNSSFNGLIHHILRSDKLLSLNDVCIHIQKEEGSVGLFGKKSDLVYINKGIYQRVDRNKFLCEHYKRKGHPKDKCWILNSHLKPSNMQSSGNALSASTTEDDMVRRSNLESLLKSIAPLKESGIAFHSLKPHKPIIVDSGASHHMICDSKLIKDIKPAIGDVVVANDTRVPVKGVSNLNLFNKNSRAFYMPDFNSNLLSVQKVTKDLDCLAIFSPNDLWFQDTKSGKIFGDGSVKTGLYVLDDLHNTSNTSTSTNNLRTDNGGEYISNEFKAFTVKLGIVHQTSCPYTPQQNGVAERKNRHLMEVARTMVFHKNVLKHFWGDAVSTACYLINRLPTKCLKDISPYEISIGINSNLKASSASSSDTLRYRKATSLKDLGSSGSDLAHSLRLLLENLNLPKTTEAVQPSSLPQSEESEFKEELDQVESNADEQEMVIDHVDNQNQSTALPQNISANYESQDNNGVSDDADQEDTSKNLDEETAQNPNMETAIHEADSPPPRLGFLSRFFITPEFFWFKCLSFMLSSFAL
ncbi:uncharacterized protein LOC112082126 [Eutrema salsugineum]|uniref:uncharacterized protein LOC112082126 n=1 Tax=Eutrema salsugineum TaxID=72664 RepID=UPI000CED5B09|nr:uncharacterized protein LOC112082126 [Eutrema salsugineum]